MENIFEFLRPVNAIWVLILVKVRFVNTVRRVRIFFKYKVGTYILPFKLKSINLEMKENT